MNEKVNIKPHNVIMNNCEKLSMTGISDVDSFDEKIILCYTDKARLAIRGYNLKVESVDTVGGDMEVSGKITSLSYSDEQKKQNIFSKLFK